MRLDLRRIESLPRLAWCARLSRGSSVVRVLHGPWVETDGDSFIAAAWDGPFAERRPDRAATVAGSAGRVEGDKLIIVAPSHTRERLWSIRAGDELIISNSLVFVLVQADDELDPVYPHYFLDMLEDHRRGVRARKRGLPTRRGRRLMPMEHFNYAVDGSLAARAMPKPEYPPVSGFASYTALIETRLRDLFANAQDPARAHRFRPVTTLSRGYDAPAIAALARRAGCEEGFTLGRFDSADTEQDDNGRAIGERLGLRVAEYDRRGFRRLPGLPDAEFAGTAAPAGDRVWAIAEPSLESSLVLNGRRGDMVWGLDRADFLPDFREPHAKTQYSLVEFGLRVGFLSFPVPYIGPSDPMRLYEISTSPEMRPWRIGGEYDRPIPRRIAEEAGVPREWFGQSKFAGAHVWAIRDGDFSPAGEADFLRFYQSLPRPGAFAAWRWRRLHRLYGLLDRFVASVRRLAFRAGVVLPFWSPLPLRYRFPVTKYNYIMQWGTHRIRDRYAAAMMKAETPARPEPLVMQSL